MKRLGIVALAAVMILALTLPALAIESEFGGYFRTRFWTAQNFTGEDDSEARDVSAVDTRTRLYYTAIFHENLKFVNMFEFDATWGNNVGSRAGTAPGNKGYGVAGADGANIEIKRSYVDFNMGPVNAKVGVQGLSVGRSFLIDPGNDMAAAVVAFKGDFFTIPVIWAKPYEGGYDNPRYYYVQDTLGNRSWVTNPGANTVLDTTVGGDLDVDIYAISPSFKIGQVADINPFFAYFYSDDAREFLGGAGELNLWYAGLNADLNFSPVTAWFTGIYQGGDVDWLAGGSSDFEGFLVAGGVGFSMGMADVWAKGFYATGDDDNNDSDIETFYVPVAPYSTIQSYYWAEIMGYGMFSDTSYAQVSNNSPADQITNIYAGNIGATIKPMPKLAVTLDVWAAWLAEDVVTLRGSEENFLGTEIDLKVTYTLVEGLNLDIIGAYLFAGDATTMDQEDDANPYEVGTQLSLSF